MAKLSLLEIVQQTMTTLGESEINSINDLELSNAVADTAKEVYFDLMSLQDWPHLQQMSQLNSLSDLTKPNYLRLPDSISEIIDIKYDKILSGGTVKKMSTVPFKDRESFLSSVFSRDTNQTNIIEVTDLSGIAFGIKNDSPPSYWTTFDDEHIIFDAYDVAVEATMNGNKSMVIAVKEPAWVKSDGFIADLPSKMFPMFLQEVKRVASANYAGQLSQPDERRGRRSFNTMVGKASRTNHKKIISFGRR